MQDRYGSDVLAAGGRPWKSKVLQVPGELGLVVECADSGWCGAIVGWDKTSLGWAVRLEDRRGAVRVFPAEPAGFLVEGRTATLTRPVNAAPVPKVPIRTASGSVAAARPAAARVARASRIWVEGRHDAELLEKVWGTDLREAGVVVEPLGGIDDLLAAADAFEPGPRRRVVVLVDHLVAHSKETRIADEVERRWAPHVRVLGHPFVDIWQAVRPEVLGVSAWPVIPRGTPWKAGVCAALGWPPDEAAAWRRILGSVRSYADLQPEVLGRVEEAIDLVTDVPE